MSRGSRVVGIGIGMLALSLVSGCRSGPQTQTSHDDLSFFTVGVGQRKWDCSWEPVEDAIVIQVGYDYEPEAWPVGIETAFQWAGADATLEGSGLTSDSFEASIGASKTLRPFSRHILWTFGAGLALTYSRETLTVFDPGGAGVTDRTETDLWPAGYAHTRLAWKFSETFDVGVDVRGLLGGNSIGLIGPVRAGEYVQATLGFGIHR